MACTGARSGRAAGERPGRSVAPSTRAAVTGRSLASFAAQPLAVVPLHAVTSEDTLLRLDPTPMREAFGTGLLAVLADQRARDPGFTAGSGWIFPEQLDRSYRRNPTYATNPRTLAVEPLRAPAFVAGVRLPEPLASQLRTLVALHEVRHVLVPVEVTITPQAGDRTAMLRYLLIDARLAEVQGTGAVRARLSRSDDVPGAIVRPLLAELVKSLAAP